MTLEGRIQEIEASVSSFKGNYYSRDEQINEMFKLQDEIVCISIPKEDQRTYSSRKIIDVKDYLKEKNDKYGNIADTEIREFEKQSKEFSTKLKGLRSGQRGENELFKTLEKLTVPNVVLKNVEFSGYDTHTEIDAIVITPGLVTLVELKSINKDVFIDEEGDYYRIGVYNRREYNIQKKLELREKIIKDILSDKALVKMKIRTLLVFSNKNIEVQNRNPLIKTCFLSQIIGIIEKNTVNTNMTTRGLQYVAETISAKEHKEEYRPDFNAKEYIHTFATIIAKFEQAEVKNETMPITTSSNKTISQKRRIVVFPANHSQKYDIYSRFYKTQISGKKPIETTRKNDDEREINLQSTISQKTDSDNKIILQQNKATIDKNTPINSLKAESADYNNTLVVNTTQENNALAKTTKKQALISRKTELPWKTNILGLSSSTASSITLLAEMLIKNCIYSL